MDLDHQKVWSLAGPISEPRSFHSSDCDVKKGLFCREEKTALLSLEGMPVFFIGSDGVLNPSGVRFGSGEIYSVMESFAHIIDDSLCVGQRRDVDQDERVLLFVKMRPGHRLSTELSAEIKNKIRGALSPRHVPSYIFEVEDIPVCLRDSFIPDVSILILDLLLVYGQ